MSIRLHSGQVEGIHGKTITVEVDAAPGMQRFILVGLPDKAVEEAKERLTSAVSNTACEPPHKRHYRITINLSPADVRKEGAWHDLAMTLGYLLATRQIKFDPSGKCFLGELGLDGSLKPLRGVLAAIASAKQAGITECFVPLENALEAALIDGVTVYGAPTLRAVIDHLEDRVPLLPTTPEATRSRVKRTLHGFEDIRGQALAKRAAEIAAAGLHHFGMHGPPGTGKTLIARALADILPPLSRDEALEVTIIHSIAGSADPAQSGLAYERPFRSPHHTSSYAAIVGGGAYPKPGELTLAHRGVLFLDEFSEFEGRVLESLREPLEDREITVSRVQRTEKFPSDILLVAAMNLCPCGKRGTKDPCACGPAQLARYARKLSGPIVDRIDLWAMVPHVDYETLQSTRAEESSNIIRERVTRAWELQQERLRGTPYRSNSGIGVRDIDRLITLSADARKSIERASTTLQLSPRAFHKLMKVSRTIADLDVSRLVEDAHILKAIQFRPRSGFS